MDMKRIEKRKNMMNEAFDKLSLHFGGSNLSICGNEIRLRSLNRILVSLNTSDYWFIGSMWNEYVDCTLKDVFGDLDCTVYQDHKSLMEALEPFDVETFKGELCDAIVEPFDIKKELKRVADKYDWLSYTPSKYGDYVRHGDSKLLCKTFNIVIGNSKFHFKAWKGEPIINNLTFDKDGYCELTEENFPEFERVLGEMDKQINHKWSLEWAKQDLLETFDWLEEDDDKNIVVIDSEDDEEIVVSLCGDINFRWCGLVLEGHPVFLFDNGEHVWLTGESYEEFKSILKWYEDNVLTLKKPWEDE